MAKTLDWYSGAGLIYINKKNIKKTSIFVGNQKPLEWTSTHASLTLTQTGLEFPWEGINDDGVSVGSLLLSPIVVPPTSDPRPAVDFTQWMQYILDTSSNLTEAITHAQLTRVAEGATIHYFVCDATSACAALEYIDGELIVSTEKDLPYAALTNDNYENSLRFFYKQLASLLPSAILASTSVKSLDRFSRAALWSSRFNPDRDQEIEYAFRGLEKVKQTDSYLRSYWNMAFELKSKTLHLKTWDAPKMKSIKLAEFNPQCSSGPEMLDINLGVEGDVTKRFVPFTDAANQKLIQSSTLLKPENKKQIQKYKKEHTHCLD